MLLPTILLILIAILIALLAYILLKPQANDPQQLELVLSRAWSNMQLDEKLGRFESYARDIRNDYRSLDQLLRSPKERSGLSEYQTHFKNLNASIHRVDAAYQKLGDEFAQIRRLSEE